MAKITESKFELSLATLEQIVVELESGELPLERALELFEEGIGLARRCQSQLEEAERKVELLLREHGEIKTVPFDQLGSEGGDEIGSSPKQPYASPKTKTIAANQENGSDDIIPF